jgi:hypothetical protein
MGVGVPVFGQDPLPPVKSLGHAIPRQQPYSPYAGGNFPSQVFWGIQ